MLLFAELKIIENALLEGVMKNSYAIVSFEFSSFGIQKRRFRQTHTTANETGFKLPLASPAFLPIQLNFSRLLFS